MIPGGKFIPPLNRPYEIEITILLFVLSDACLLRQQQPWAVLWAWLR